MPRSFDMSTDYGGTVEQVHRTFGDQNYWLARLAGSGADEASLESLRVGGRSGRDGSIEVVTIQVLHGDRLPGVITQFHRGDLRIRREESWSPVNDGAADATVVGSIADAPVTLSGTAVLSPVIESGGARLKLRATVEVRIPLVGGKIENLVSSQLIDLLAAEQRFTTTWISENG